MNLSAKTTSEFNIAFFGSLNILILLLFFLIKFNKNFFGSYFLGQPILRLNENLTKALKLSLKNSKDKARENQLLLRGIEYLVPRMVSKSVPKSKKITFDTESSYLITGGLGGLGLACCEWMIERGAKRVVFIILSFIV